MALQLVTLCFEGTRVMSRNSTSVVTIKVIDIQSRTDAKS